MLKRIYLVCAFIVYTSGMMFCQTLSLGPVVGANFSDFTDATSSKTLVGLALGGFGNYSINEHIAINAKLLFNQMGAGTEDSDDIVRLNYISLPLSAVYYFGKLGDKIRPKLFVGPYVSYLLNAKNQNGDEIVLPNGDDIFNTNDFGGLVGAGFNYSLKDRTWLNVDASYSRGFTNLLDASTSTSRNTGFQITAGLSFPIGK